MSSVEDGGDQIVVPGRRSSQNLARIWQVAQAGALGKEESVMGVARKTKRGAKSVKGKAKKDAGKVKRKGKKAKNAAKR